MAFSILRNAGVVPGEVELMRQVEELERRLKNCESHSEAQNLGQQLQASRAKLTVVMERRKLRKNTG